MSLNGITANGTKIEDVVINLLSSGVAASSDPPSVIVDGDQSEYWDGLLSLSVRQDVVAKKYCTMPSTTGSSSATELWPSDCLSGI